MMKNYTITVNGNVYEVTVEEGFTGKASAPKAAAPAPAPAAAPAAPAPAAAPAPGWRRWYSTRGCPPAARAQFFPDTARSSHRRPLPAARDRGVLPDTTVHKLLHPGSGNPRSGLLPR